MHYVLDTVAQGLDIGARRLDGVVTPNGPIAADGCVLAAGAESAALLGRIGIDLSPIPAEGHSAAEPIARHELAPLIAIMDERFNVVVARIGERPRIAGTAVIGDRSVQASTRTARTLLKVARDWYPRAAVFSQTQWWAGARPMLPDGPPVLGRTPIDRMYLNVGHGSSGWAMSCGAARVVASIVTGHMAGIDMDSLTLDRYTRPALSQLRPAFSTP